VRRRAARRASTQPNEVLRSFERPRRTAQDSGAAPGMRGFLETA
jgi:hypothetical protein